MEGYYTVAEVCALLKVTRTTIQRWEDDEWFPQRVRLTRHVRGRCGFPIAEVDAWDMARRKARGEVPLSE